MTDAGAPLSRRERRERERRNAAPEFDDLATGETEARGGEGRTLSRRERRALERTMHPMETWTAEEEMLATGQLPAMTPDVIAAEERNARERAEQAALEAQATSSELSRADIERERARAAGQLPESEGPERLSTALPSPSADTEPAPEPAAPQAPGMSSPAPQSEQQSAAPAFSWPEPQSPSPANAPAAATSEPFTWPAAPEAPQSAPGTSEPDVQGQAPAWPTPDSESVLPQPPAQAPAPVVETEVTPPAESSRQRFTGLSRPTPEAATSPAEASYVPEATHGGEQAPGAHDVESAASAEPVAPTTASPGDAPASQESADDPAADSAAPTGVAEADPGALPDILKDLFPAGSPQARMMEEGAAYARAQAEHPVARTPIPLPETATPADSEPARDAQPEEPVAAGEPAVADEPAETIAADPQAAVAPPEAQQSQPTPTSTPTQAPRAEDPAAEMRRLADEAMANLMNAGTSLDSHTVDDAARAAGEAMAESRGEVAPHDRELPEGLFHDAPATPTPATAQPFVNLHGDSSTTQVLPPVAPFGQSAVEPAESATGTVAPSWEQGNLQPATPAGFNPDDYVPSSDIPLPDLSALEQAAHPNTASGANGSGEIPYVAAPVTDGIEVPRREVPQLQPGHGARDMHWAHFLVIGAVAFVLGLLVYQLAGLGS
ncbi:hypothetical protein [Demequina zhanjiangensis]|uniref:Meckel syndrome type 1 protein n=1 Tax=Demequina zhanjiangensis TaxID=3051659 RepID=A0ABT8G121_9MICO|nr:hypothetical protein [Demequina sp. SYSU T00b26]MDN4472414.1 hypothetical protein [Demequina sp. SYSU T00b26]